VAKNRLYLTRQIDGQNTPVLLGFERAVSEGFIDTPRALSTRNSQMSRRRDNCRDATASTRVARKTQGGYTRAAGHKFAFFVSPARQTPELTEVCRCHSESLLCSRIVPSAKPIVPLPVHSLWFLRERIKHAQAASKPLADLLRH